MSEIWWVCTCVLNVCTSVLIHAWPEMGLPHSSALGVPGAYGSWGWIMCTWMRKRSWIHCSVTGIARVYVCVYMCMIAQWVVLASLCHLVLLFQCCADTCSLACFYSLCFSLSFFIPFSSSSHSVIKQNKLSSLRSARRLVLFTSYPSTVCHHRWDFSSRGWMESQPCKGRVWWLLAPCQALPQQAW